MKTFFFGDHLAVKGTKIPFKGPELLEKTFFSFLETTSSQRSARGPHWGKLPTLNCKALSPKISTRSLTVDLKKRLSRKRNCISYKADRAVKRSATILSYDTAAAATRLRFATLKLPNFSLFSHSVIAVIKIFKISALEITVYTPITVAKQYKQQKKTPRKGH